jgi:tetratricopeptide (TPR) repeat protein
MSLSAMKSRIGLLAAPIVAAVLLSLAIAGTSIAEISAPVPVRIAHHGNFTRIVFEFPKLLAYHVKVTDGDALIDFDTNAVAAFAATKSPLVKSIREIPNSEGVLKVEIELAGGTTVKHYRLQRKVVVDVYSSAPPAKKKARPARVAAKKKSGQNAAPVKITANTSVPSPEPVSEPAPAPETAPAPSPETDSVPAQETAPKEAVQEPLKTEAAEIKTEPPVPAAAVHGDEKVDDRAPEATTEITLSFLAPSRLAVFERSSVLWVVSDFTASTATPPVITGPMAEFVAPPKTLRFEGGTAYRYTFPKKFYPRVEKQNLTWKISLLPEPYEPPPPVEIKVEFDPTSRKAKLILPLKEAGNALSFEDPDVGDALYVVPTGKPDQVIRNVSYLTDFAMIPTVLGMVVRPLKDGLRVNPVHDFVSLTSPDGLTATPEGVGTPVLIGEADALSDDDNNRLFDFPNWRQGGLRMLWENRRKLQDEIVISQTPGERAGLLMKMAMLYFSNNFGQETLGVLELVLIENPDMEKNPNFIAMRGAANAMSGHFNEALQDLSYPPIQNNPEVNLWIGFAAAATEQWLMADRSFPKSNRLLLQYPDNIAIPFTIYMAESALHMGHTDTAKKLLDTINMTSEALAPQYQAAISYLRGETLSQDGKPEQAEEVWQPVANGLDRLYHAKTSLAMTRLLLQQKKISLKDAVERIDSLRFAWRGDGLEVEILHMLGALRIQNGQVLSGLQDMKQATDLADSLLNDSTPVRDEMKSVFSDLFVGGQASKLSPLEAVSIYGEFNTLLPAGLEGATATLGFADYLVSMDLLPKAAELIEDQIGIGMPEEKIISAGEKLAAVYLLDKRPQQALEALGKTERSNMTAKDREERGLLRARAQSQLNQTDAAIGTLSTMTSRNAGRLKADVLWRAQKWAAAAETIETLLPDAGRPISEEDASLVVNAAVARKLSGNVEKLKEIKEKFGAAMEETKLASTFGVVTREGGSSSLADRESMLKIAGEVDMFKGFLDAYKAGAGKGG